MTQLVLYVCCKESTGNVSAVMTQLGIAQLAEYVCSKRINWYSLSAVVTQLGMTQM
jgi:hypothetical protein